MSVLSEIKAVRVIPAPRFEHRHRLADRKSTRACAR